MILGGVVLAAVGCSSVAEQEAVEVGLDQGAVAPAAAGAGGGSRRQIVVFKSETLPADATARITKAGGKVRRAIAAIGVATIDADAATVRKLAADGAIASIGSERSWTLPKDLRGKKTRRPPPPAPTGFLWGAQWDQRHIHAPRGSANVAAAAQAKVSVAVIDSGVMFDHPDLAGQVTLAQSFNYASQNCPATEAQVPPGYPIYLTRINAITGDLCENVGFDPTTAIDAHGTHVSGTIAAKGEIGVAGVGTGLKIAAYKVFDRVLVPATPVPGAPPPPPGATEEISARSTGRSSLPSRTRSIAASR